MGPPSIPPVFPPAGGSTMAVPGPPESGPAAEPGPGHRRRRAATIAAIGMATIAVLAGAWVVYGYLTRGGASSPEAAVQTLADALQSQDPALAATVINPKEVPFLVDLTNEIGEARKRVDIGSNGDLLAGTDIKVQHLRLGTRELGPRVARVTIRSGRIELSAKGARLPDLIRRSMIEPDSGNSRGTIDLSDAAEEVTLVVVDDGGWYISPALTAADMIVNRNDVSDRVDYSSYGDTRDFDPGSDTPEDAVDALVDAVSSGDPNQMLSALPSDQGQFGVVYGDALRSVLKKEVRSTHGSGKWDGHWLRVKGLDVQTEDAPGGTKRLLIRSARASSTYGSGEWKVSGSNICEAGTSDCFFNWSTREPIARRVKGALGGSFSLIARQVDGGWKVDPVASIADMATRLVKAVDLGFARSFLMSTSGDPTARITPGTGGDVRFDRDGYALVAIPTKPGAAYAVQVDTKETWTFELRLSSEPSKGSDLTASAGGLERVGNGSVGAFVADAAETKVALGGVRNTMGSAKVTIYEVPINEQPLGQQVQGTLAAPVALYRVPISDKKRLVLESSATGSQVRIGMSDLDKPEKAQRPGWVPTYTTVELDAGGSDTTAETFEGEAVLVAVWGKPGAGFTFTLGPDPRGFGDTGEASGKVTVPAGATIQVPMVLGHSDVDFTVNARWDASVDVDSWLVVDGQVEDSDTYTESGGGTVSLDGSGSGSAVLRLQNYGSVPVEVQLSVDFDS